MTRRKLRWALQLIAICGLAIWTWGGAGSAATSDNALWAAQSFQRLAALDVSAAEAIWMTSDVAASWSRLTEDALADSMHAAAFFGHMLWFPWEGPGGTWLVGLVNVWVGSVLILQFNEPATSMIGFHLLTVPMTPINNGSTADLGGSVAQRFSAALSALASEISTWPRRGTPEASPSSWTELDSRVSEYLEETRRLLSPDGLSVWADARTNLADAQDVWTESDPSGVLEVSAALPLAWRQLAIPVWVSEHADALHVVWSADADPYSLLWVSVKTRVDSEPLHDAAVVDILEAYTETQGGGS